MRDSSNDIVTQPRDILHLENRLAAKFKKSDTTPNVEGVEYWTAHNTSGVTISKFKGGKNTHTLFVLGDGFTTVSNNTVIKTNTAANKLLLTNSIYIFVYFDGVWYEIADSTGSSIPAGSGYIYYGNGSPEGVVTASIGDIYEQRDSASTTNPLWVKRSGTATNTGWFALAGFAGSALHTIAIGAGAVAGGTNSVAIGDSANARTGLFNVLIGDSSSIVAGKDSNVVIGYAAVSNGLSNINIGAQTGSGTGTFGIAIGSAATCSSSSADAIAIGSAATNGASNSICIGKNSISSVANTCVIGSSGSTGIKNFRVGGDAVAVPDNNTWRINDGFGTNIAGGTWTFQASKATGNATPGSFIFQVSARVGGGTTLQTPTTRLVIDENGASVTGTLTVNGSTVATGGEANTASNLGSGTGVWVSKVGVDLRFKSISVAGSVAIANTATDITITGNALDRHLSYAGF